MKKIALTAAAIAALGLGACQSRTANNSATANTSGNANANASHNASGEAGHSNVQTVVNNGLEGAGNLASEAGDVIENNARAAYNGVKEVGRDIADGPDRAPANKTGN